jgi:predicted NBD/HSP70 family sugar kinase
MSPARPSLDLLRSLTDEHVLRALMETRRLTRAELASRTAISKPTVSNSVLRLTEAGMLRATGERAIARGGVGSYYSLADDLGVALVASIAPDGIVAEAIDVHGDVVCREVEPIPPHPGGSGVVAEVLRAVSKRVLGATKTARLAVVSAADPVDRITGDLVQLPDAPFLVGELSPVDILRRLVAGEVVVDNDVHWAARAEREVAGAGRLNDYAYLYLGEGLGCAVVSDGEVRRGNRGIAGEVAHLITRGHRGRATSFTEVFAALHLRRPASTAIDTQAVMRLLESSAAATQGARTVLTEAICDVIAGLIAFTDPQLVVIGGTWGPHPALLERVDEELRRQPRQVEIRGARVTTEPSLTGARHHALEQLRRSVLERAAAST